MRVIAVTAWMCVLAAGPAGAAGAQISGDDVRPGAPGTLVVDGREIRLFDIRMPGPQAQCAEWDGNRQMAYPCHVHARAVLESLVAARPVACVGRDDAGDAAVCYVDGRDVGAELVAAGWARACGRSSRYVAYEQAARDGGRGLWAGQFTLDGACPGGDAP